MLPDCGFNKPKIIFIKVLFPAPDFPMIATFSPLFIVKFIFSKKCFFEPWYEKLMFFRVMLLVNLHKSNFRASKSEIFIFFNSFNSL